MIYVEVKVINEKNNNIASTYKSFLYVLINVEKGAKLVYLLVIFIHFVSLINIKLTIVIHD